jgi:ERCC4-type nuclease
MKKKIPRTQASKKDKNLLINTSDSEKEEKPKKSKKQKQKCVNAFNDYYYDHFIELSQKAAAQRQIYSQIIPLRNIAASIKKYPFPIVTLEQANSIQGIGEHFIGKFKKLINDYKSEIKEKKIDYMSLAFKVKPELGEENLKKKRERSKNEHSGNETGSKKVVSFSNPGTKKASQLKEIKAEAKKLKFKNNLINIPTYTSIWTTAVCCYISFFDKESYEIEYNSISEYGKILKNKFLEFNINIEEPNVTEDKKDIEELKNLKLIDTVKKHKITINDYLIKLVKIELEKIGLSIKKDPLNQALEMTKLEINKNSINNINNNNDIIINDDSDNDSDDQIKNKLLEEYIDFMKFESNEKINSSFSENIYLIVDLREKGAGNENFRVEILNKMHSPIPIEEKNLSLGDFTWIYKDQLDGEEYMIDFIIERKTLNDLSASIMDGRYNEQKYRLKNSPYKNIYYLFEGTELNTHSNTNISKDSINTAINNTINIHNIKFFRTLSTKDTVNKLIELDSNIRKHFTFLKDINGKKINYKKYLEIFAKTKNSSVEEIFLRQLRCFEHCGKKCVEVLNSCFQTPVEFYNLIQGLKRKKVDENNMEDVIACCYYLHENKKDINVKNVLECFDIKEEIEKFKKDIFFAKLMRKMAVLEMFNFYCFYDENKNKHEEE